MSDHLRSNSIRFPVEPRDVPAQKAARRLHLTEVEFEEKLTQLRDRGFPPPDPTTGMFDLKAIDEWMDGRFGLTRQTAPRDSRQTFRERMDKLTANG